MAKFKFISCQIFVLGWIDRARTDHGAFWVTKNDGANWEENSTRLANNYIRSICPSRFATSRVYLAMTGINYDDLQSYLYVSEDDGQHSTSIATGLPNEPVNTILEDPRFCTDQMGGKAKLS